MKSTNKEEMRGEGPAISRKFKCIKSYAAWSLQLPKHQSANSNRPLATRSLLQQVHESSDEYGGPEAFSEPQTRIVREVVSEIHPQAFINLHSGEWAMYVPWDSKKEVAEKLPVSTACRTSSSCLVRGQESTEFNLQSQKINIYHYKVSI